MIKWNALTLLLMCLSSFHVLAEGEQTLAGWEVRWSDYNDSGYVYATIVKSDRVEDHNGMKVISMSITQEFDNQVIIGAVFKESYASSPCKESTKNVDVTAEINMQPVRMNLETHQYNCDTYLNWRPISEEGKKFLRSAFNSGVVRFAHGSFDYIYDTRNSLPAYKLMQEMIEHETKLAKSAL